LAPSYLKSLEGSSIIDFEDATGRKVIREEIAIARTQGQGFLWDTFTKPDEPTHKQFKQLAYVKNFGIYDWYLGSAEYLDTATRNTNEHLLETINQVSQGETDYFFVIDAEGTLLLNYARPDIVGKNILKTDNEELKTLYKNILKSTKTQEGGFLTYDWPNPRTAQLDSKTTFVKMVPQSHWIIGSGFYPKSLENAFTIQEQRLTHRHEQKIRHLNKLTGLSVLISLLVSIFISILFYRFLAQYQYELIEANNELKDLNIALEKKVLDKEAELRNAQQEIEGLAIVDNLTQVANRYKLMKRLNTEIDRANRFNESFSVVMLDIDFFKKINDEYGRSVGDQVLQELASLLMAELRTVDLLGRFGDEEFLIIMPNTLLEEAFNAAERMRKKVECYDFELNQQLTISLGVAQYHANEQVQDLIKNADMALYQAKNSGRNKTGQAKGV
ncbi:MAG: diguanylate cyclase, partial [Thiomicrorhabdus sp.]|nr:diguanylate cyclase [Thiomicrorhabdus sp.]